MTFSRSWRFRFERENADNWADMQGNYPSQNMFRPKILTVYVEPRLERPSAATWIIRGPQVDSKGLELGTNGFFSNRQTEARHPPLWAVPYIETSIARAQLDYDYMRSGAMAERLAQRAGGEDRDHSN